MAKEGRFVFSVTVGPTSTSHLQSLILGVKCKQNITNKLTNKQKKPAGYKGGKTNNPPKLLKVIRYKNSHGKSMQEAGSVFHKAKISLKDLHSNSKNNNDKNAQQRAVQLYEIAKIDSNNN